MTFHRLKNNFLKAFVYAHIIFYIFLYSRPPFLIKKELTNSVIKKVHYTHITFILSKSIKTHKKYK